MFNNLFEKINYGPHCVITFVKAGKFLSKALSHDFDELSGRICIYDITVLNIFKQHGCTPLDAPGSEPREKRKRVCRKRDETLEISEFLLLKLIKLATAPPESWQI